MGLLQIFGYKPSANGHTNRVIHHGKPRVATATADVKVPPRRDKSSREIARLVDEVEVDVQFSMARLVIESMVAATPITITPSVDDASSVAMAESLQETWYDSLGDMLRFLAYGRQSFEFWYDAPTLPGLYRPIEKLKALPFLSTSVEVADDGAETVCVVVDDGKVELGPEVSWTAYCDRSAEWPEGRSRYLGQVEKVLAQRRKLDSNNDRFLSKYANGFGVVKAPSQYGEGTTGGKGEANQLNDNGQPADPIVDTVNRFLQAKDGGWVGLPSEYDRETNQPLFDYSEHLITSNAAPLENQQRRLDDAAFMAMGVPPRAVSQDGSVGSLALSKAHVRILQYTIEGVVSQLVKQYTELCDRVAAVNSKLPLTFTVEWQSVDDDRVQQLFSLVEKIVTAPAVLPMVASGAVDLAALIEASGLPGGEDIAGILQRLAEFQKAQAPVPPSDPWRQQLSLSRGGEKSSDNPPFSRWGKHADELAKVIEAKREELLRTLSDDQDRGRL